MSNEKDIVGPNTFKSRPDPVTDAPGLCATTPHIPDFVPPAETLNSVWMAHNKLSEAVTIAVREYQDACQDYGGMLDDLHNRQVAVTAANRKKTKAFHTMTTIITKDAG